MDILSLILWSSWLSATAYAECSDSTNVTQTTFLLCNPDTCENEDDIQTILHDASNLMSTNFDSTRRTFVMMHGFNENGTDWPFTEAEAFNAAFKNATARLGVNFNLIYVNWRCLASPVAQPVYITAAKNALKVGNYTGEFLDNLITKSSLSHSNLHLVGFSLGGQGVGAMGRKLEELTGTKADRLTSIDPAAPFFDILEPEGNWIGYNDANYVDVIHVNSDFLFCGGVSLGGPLGNVDFYPNGGLHQPGCTDVGPLMNFWINDYVGIDASCSHSKGKAYFRESLTYDFTGTLCGSWENFTNGDCDGNAQLNMGIALNSSQILGTGLVTYGKYYMNVNECSPYYPKDPNRQCPKEREFTPDWVGFWGRYGAGAACSIAKFLKKVTFNQYDVTQTEWYHGLMSTAWYNYS